MKSAWREADTGKVRETGKKDIGMVKKYGKGNTHVGYCREAGGQYRYGIQSTW